MTCVLDFRSMSPARCVALGLLFLMLNGCQAPTASVAGTSTPPPRREVAALGRLEPKDRVIDISVAGDERLSRLLVKQGQMVKAGDILGYLETYDTRLAARDRAAALVHDTEEQLRANVGQGQARIKEADLQLAQQKQVSVRGIEAQEARVRQTKAELDLAEREVERLRSLTKNEIISRQDFDRQTSQADRLRAALESEQATLLKLKTSAETDRDIAEAQLATRKAELVSVQASAQLESLREGLKFAEAELKISMIRAPSDGQIIEVIANPGEAVQGRVILRMGDVSEMYVLAEVYEADVSRVRLGQHVEISSSALSQPLTGTVERIGTNVFKRQVRNIDPQADTDARVVQVRARLDNSDEAARFVGLQVDVRIHADEAR
jgi:HlyD family secretion protein